MRKRINPLRASKPLPQAFYYVFRNRLGCLGGIVYADHHRLAHGAYLSSGGIAQYLLQREAFLSNLFDACPHFHRIGEADLLHKGAVEIDNHSLNATPVGELTAKGIVEFGLPNIEQRKLGIIVYMAEHIDVVESQLQRHRMAENFNIKMLQFFVFLTHSLSFFNFSVSF